MLNRAEEARKEAECAGLRFLRLFVEKNRNFVTITRYEKFEILVAGVVGGMLGLQ